MHTSFYQLIYALTKDLNLHLCKMSIMEDDREERLSFSDLQFFSDDLQVESKVLSFDENKNPISSPTNQDFLGFFLDGNRKPNALENIIFCGKIIDPSRNNQNPNHDNKTNIKKITKSDLPIWNSGSNNGRSSSCNSRSRSLSASWIKNNNYDKKEKTSKLSCSSKSRWHVFMFGSGKFPKKMEMSDIRRRQLQWSRWGQEEKSNEKQLYLSGLIRALVCSGGFDDNEMIKGSVGYLNPF